MKFRLVDRIVSWTPWSAIRGVKAASFEEYMLKAPFGGDAALPDTLLLESLFQLGNWLIVLSSDFAQLGLVVRTEAVAFDNRLRPGEHAVLEAVVRRHREDGLVFDGQATVDGRTIISGHGCLAVPAPLADYTDPADLRVLFSEIYAPERLEEEGAAWPA